MHAFRTVYVQVPSTGAAPTAEKWLYGDDALAEHPPFFLTLDHAARNQPVDERKVTAKPVDEINVVVLVGWRLRLLMALLLTTYHVHDVILEAQHCTAKCSTGDVGRSPGPGKDTIARETAPAAGVSHAHAVSQGYCF